MPGVIIFLFIGIAIWFAYTRMLAKLMKPTLWNQLLYALPSVAFAINLAIYYLALGITLLFSEAGTTAREAGRAWVFDEIDLPFNQEMKFTVLATLIVTALVMAAVYMLRDKDGDA